MTTSTTWPELLPGLLAAWQGEGSANLPDESSRHLAEQPPEHRRAFLDLSRRELANFPFDRVHPQWIARALPADPCLQHWAMQIAPAPMRATLARFFPAPTRPGTGRSWVEPTGPPGWFEGWWISQLRVAIPWPDELPWRREDPHPLARMARLGETDLLRVLEHVGTRAAAAAVHADPPQQLVATLFAFPEEVRERLVGLVRARAFPSEAWWPQRWAELAQSPPVDRLRLLALVEIAALARAEDRHADGLRLGWHLAPELGEYLHHQLEREAPLADAIAERLARLEGDLA